MIKYLDEKDDFNSLIKEKNYLVDFYADWCGPCQMLGKTLEKIDYVDILKVNTDQFSELAIKYGVMSIPTLIYFENGEVKNQSIGFVDESKIKEMIE